MRDISGFRRLADSQSYDTDLERASRLMPLVTEGFAASLPEAAIRFAISHPAIGTVLVGMASVDEFEVGPGGGAGRTAAAAGTAPGRRTHRKLLGRDPLIDTVSRSTSLSGQ